MNTRELQQKLIEIISTIVVENNDEAVKAEQERALKVINDLRDHINNAIEYNNYRMTALDYIIFFDTQGYGSNNPTRINNSALLELGRAIIDVGGKTSQELERVCEIGGQSQGFEIEIDFPESSRVVWENLQRQSQALRQELVDNSERQARTIGRPIINVGTIGHVDHGRTTLTAALTQNYGSFTAYDAIAAPERRRGREVAEEHLREHGLLGPSSGLSEVQPMSRNQLHEWWGTEWFR